MRTGTHQIDFSLDQAGYPLIATLLGNIRRELDAAPTLDAFRDRILTLYPDLSFARMSDLQGILAKDLAGRYDIERVQ